MANSPKMVFGLGRYEARWIGEGPMVRLTATGLLPCSSYEVQLEKRPERVSPPMWNMVFFVNETCDHSVKPFFAEAVMINASGGQAVLVHDALGLQEVPIHSKDGIAAQMKNAFVVYARLPKAETGLQGCITVPHGAIVSADRYPAFGPATKAECDDFIKEACAEGPDLQVAGGEVPWPLLV